MDNIAIRLCDAAADEQGRCFRNSLQIRTEPRPSVRRALSFQGSPESSVMTSG